MVLFKQNKLTMLKDLKRYHTGFTKSRSLKSVILFRLARGQGLAK